MVFPPCVVAVNGYRWRRGCRERLFDCERYGVACQ